MLLWQTHSVNVEYISPKKALVPVKTLLSATVKLSLPEHVYKFVCIFAM